MKRLLAFLFLMTLGGAAALAQSRDLPGSEQKESESKPKEKSKDKSKEKSPDPSPSVTAATAPSPPESPAQQLPEGYVIGPEDVLQIQVTGEPALSVRVFVRPDGMISYPTLDDIPASGLTPIELKERITKALLEYIRNPQVSVLVMEIHSWVVYVQGAVLRPGVVPLGGPMTIMELIVRVGGFQEFAKTEKVQILRTENGKQVRYIFNYKKFLDAKDDKDYTQNITLKRGDMVIVPL